MALALAGGALRSGVLRAGELVIAEPDSAQRKRLEQTFPGAKTVSDARSAVAEAEHVVLAVKPHVLKSIAPELASAGTPQHLWVSIAAGIPLADLQSMLGSSRVIRVMPNTPAQVGAGASAIAHDDSADPQDVSWVQALMGAVGSVVTVPDQLMHAVTGISGSGPAYIFLVIEALSDGGVAMGLSREVATQLAAQTVLGAAKLVIESGMHPGQLKDQVTSPGGTTIAALRTLESAGVRSAFIEAVASCARRSAELGSQ